jgi:hypothetical protein
MRAADLQLQAQLAEAEEAQRSLKAQLFMQEQVSSKNIYQHTST